MKSTFRVVLCLSTLYLFCLCSAAGINIFSLLCRECFFTAEAALNKSRFLSQLNNSFGSGGMGLSLNEAQFALFIQHLKNLVGAPLCIRKAASIIGLQPCGNVWVFGSDIQVSNNNKNLGQEYRDSN